MARTVPIHNLRANHSEWTPPAVAYLDTEAKVLTGTDPEVLALSLWVAHRQVRRKTRTRTERSEWARGITRGELADQVNAWSRTTPVLWCYAHNLAFDLATTLLPEHLVARGWTVTDFTLSGSAPWVRLAHGDHTLLLADSGSWLPLPLAEVARRVGIRKPPLPADDDSDATWYARCRADVAILASAMGQLMDWWDANALGRWSITGPASGWNAYRHLKVPGPPVIDPDPAKQARDRQAVRGGRRDMWRFGHLQGGPWATLDITAAHPTIARWLDLPRRRMCTYDRLALDSTLIDHPTLGLLADATVTTATPRYPVTIAGSTWWPTGTFTTTLAGPEVRAARDRGELVALANVDVHALGRHMTPWAAWVLDLMAGGPDGTPKVVPLVAKAWGRAVIGKWAARSSTKLDLGDAPTPGWSTEDGIDIDTGARGRIVDLGGRRWWAVQDQPGENAYPAVLAWVESELRVRMAEVIDILGPELVVTCDTDGVLVDLGVAATSTHRARLGLSRYRTPGGIAEGLCRAVAAACEPLSIRVKAVHDDVTVLGPQAVELDGQRRIAGVRRDAESLGDGRFRSRAWPKLSWQMANGDSRGYVTPMVTSHVQGPYTSRWVCGDGSLWPTQARIGADGTTELVPWAELHPRPAFDIPAANQHPTLAKLL